MKKKAKKFFLPSVALIGSFLYSAIFAIGALLGYLCIEVFCKKFVKTGRVKLLIFNFKNWQIHLHHWLIAASIIILASISNSFSLPIFWSGVLGGLIFHDIYTDRKWQGITGKAWYHVVYKKPAD